MSPFKAYVDYVAIKAHFTSSYDYHKYQGKMSSLKEERFDVRRDKIHFQKIAKHRDPKGFILANIVNDTSSWAGNIAYSADAERVYLEKKKLWGSLTYETLNYISSLEEFDFSKMFIGVPESYPPIINQHFAGKLSLEILTAIASSSGALSVWNKKYADDPISFPLIRKIKKYKPFLEFDSNKIRSRILEKLKESE